MELGEFVKESIKQLIDGVIDAQKYAEEKGAAVNPVGLYINGQNFLVDQGFGQPPIPQMIDFDIVVSASEGGEIKAGIGVFGGAIGLGTQAKNEDSNTVANRIRFVVPVMFPQQNMPQK